MRMRVPVSAGDMFVGAMYPALSLLWALLWIMVAYHYLSAAIATWKLNGATWKTVCCDIFDPMMYAVRDFICRSKFWCRVFRIDLAKQGLQIVPTSSPGNVLRFAIFVASMTPISFGLAFAFVEVWRGDPWKLAITMIFMFTSILGAFGHLFLANRENPRRWSSIIVYSILWVMFSPLLFLAMNVYGVVR